MEIQVGEYVRTKKGEMGKVLKVDGDWIETSLNEGHLIYNQQLKHSKNIIDLVEVGDCVKFKNKLPNIPRCLEDEEMVIHIFDNDTLEEVKEAIKDKEIEIISIVTYQSFKQVEYEV